MNIDKQIVDLVIALVTEKTPNADICARLESLGVPSAIAKEAITSVKEGFKAGTLAIITGGRSVQRTPNGQNSLYDIAFKRGKSAMRYTTPGWVLLRMAWPYILGICIVLGAIIFWKMK